LTQKESATKFEALF